MNPDIAFIVNDPAWLPHRYDPGYDAFHFRRVTRDQQRQAPFLIDEYLPPAATPVVLTRADVEAALDRERLAVPHLVLHSAFCCSTLVARAFDADGLATVIREPVVLNDLIGWRHRGADPARFDAVAATTMALLGRPFLPGEGVVVKPSNIVNAHADTLFRVSSATRAVLMYAPLATFLTSVAKKGMEGHLWVRGVFLSLIRDGVADFGYDGDALFGQTDLQIAALGWLAQHRLFQRLLASPAAPRAASLASERLLDDPAAALMKMAALFGLPLNADGAQAIGQGPVFTRHSKTGVVFAAGDRQAEYRAALDEHAATIDKVAYWATQVAGLHGIALTLPCDVLTHP